MKFLAILLVLFCFLHSWAKPDVLIMTLAQVKSNVITTREVQIHDVLKKTLGGQFDNFLEDSSLEQIIKEWLLYLEAFTFYNAKVPASKIEKKKAEVLKRVKGVAAWKALHVTGEELRLKIRRRLEAERLYLFKKKASILPVPLSEVETEYSQNRIRYGNMSFSEAKVQIRKNKIKENLQNRLEKWFQVLEKKYNVQRFSEYIGQ